MKKDLSSQWDQRRDVSYPELPPGVVFQPNPGPQEEFLAASEQEVLYGGAAGGGKSYALLADAMRDLSHPQFSGLLVRHTTEELRELKMKSQELYPKVFGDQISWSERKQSWNHVNGGTLWMTYLDRDEDVNRYQGQAFNWIGFDELTHWPSPFCWEYLRSRLRTTAKNLTLSMRATTNPGNVGGWWVKKMFIDPAPPGVPFWATDIETGETLVWPEWDAINNRPHRNAGQPLFKRRFIPSRLSDNPYLYYDDNYERNLLGMPEVQRRQLLEGSWDVMEGAAFPEWNRAIHVVEPYKIPDNWLKFRACDYGYSSYSAVVWFAMHPSGQLVIYRDLEVKGVHAEALADMIRDIEHREHVNHGILDWSVFAQRGERGPSIGERLQRHGLRWRPADRTKGSRIAGKNEIHRRLQMLDEQTGEPGLVVFSTCTNVIAQLPSIPLDKNNPEDVDTKARDHIYDAVRYGVNSRPNPGTLYASDPRYFNLGPTRGTKEHFKPYDKVFGY